MTTSSHRKGNDNGVETARKTSQFYVDLHGDDTPSDYSSCTNNSEQSTESNKNTFSQECVSRDLLVATDAVSSPVTDGLVEIPQNSPRGPECVTKGVVRLERKPYTLQSNCKERTKPAVAPRKGRAASNKGHTQIGVLVIPDSLCESPLYRERVSSDELEKMGSKHSKGKNGEEEKEEEDEPLPSHDTTANRVSRVVYNQYNSVVAQLCDYLYTSPILPDVHHSYNYGYQSRQAPPPAPPPKDKHSANVNTDNTSLGDDVSSCESVSESTLFLSTGNTPHNSIKESVIKEVISGDDSRMGVIESGDRIRNNSDLVKETASFVIEDLDVIRDNTPNICEAKGSISSQNSNQSSVSNEVVYLDSNPTKLVEDMASCKIISNNTLEAENILYFLNPDDVDFASINDTNECDFGVQSLPHDPSTSSMFDVLCDTNQNDTLNSSDVAPKANHDTDSIEKRDKKIFLIAQELMTSERVFVEVLKLLNIDFRNYVLEHMGSNIIRHSIASQTPNNPNKVNKSLMHEEELNKILNYLPQLQNLNEEILKDLEERITDWERHKKISDVIVRKGPFLKLYSAYIKEFQSQCDILEECCHKFPQFGKVVKDFELSERCAKLSIRHFMLKPVQRIPQYRLLLEDYLKKLPGDSPDYVDTQTALAVVSNVATHANDTMKQGTNFMKLLALQYRLTRSQHSSSPGDNNNQPTTTSSSSYELIRAGRYLLKEGELLKLCRRGMQPRYYILLSDVLLYTSYVTSGTGGALRLNYELPLEGMRVETPKAEDFKNEFSVISTSRSFTLQASSAEERDAWIKALKEAIEDNASRRSTFLQAKIPSFQQPATSTLGKQAPVWIPDYRVTMCQHCTAEFTLTFRRHHCRACGKVVCDHCSANRAPLQYKRNQSVRVCDRCFEVLQKEFECKYGGSVTVEDPQETKVRRVDSLKAQFKRGDRDNRSHIRKRVPDRLLEVSASDSTSQMCGYLRVMVRRSWRRGWFVLKDRVLYEYRAPQDVCALQSLPVLGYQVEAMEKARDVSDGLDTCLAFQLLHPNQPPLVFHADSPHLAEKWIEAMKEAVVLS